MTFSQEKVLAGALDSPPLEGCSQEAGEELSFLTKFALAHYQNGLIIW